MTNTKQLLARLLISNLNCDTNKKVESIKIGDEIITPGPTKLFIPWYGKNKKIRGTDIIFNNDIIDTEINSNRYEYLIKNNHYYIQSRPSGGLFAHITIYPERVIANVFNISHDGIYIELNEKGIDLIKKANISATDLFAVPTLLHNGKQVVFGNIYLVYNKNKICDYI